MVNHRRRASDQAERTGSDSGEQPLVVADDGATPAVQAPGGEAEDGALDGGLRAVTAAAEADGAPPAAGGSHGESPVDDDAHGHGRRGRARARVKKALHLPRQFRKAKPGAAAGIEPHELPPVPALTGATRITCIDYSADRFEQQEVQDLPEFIRTHRPEWSQVRWINVDGVSDLGVVRAVAEKYHLHPLAVEDVLHVPQRPRAQPYEETNGYQARLFVIVRMLELRDSQLLAEQVSMFIGHRTVITFQETPGDVWDPIRQRLRLPGSRVRMTDASFLAYSLIDAVVDQAFPILEHFGDRLETLEDTILEHPTTEVFHEIHRLKRELLLLRRAMWPMREVVQRLAREPHECFSQVTQTYIRDVYDHAVQIIDILETYREMATGLTETYMTAMSNRMNEIMKVLTIIGTIFIPLTFIAGVYGMNFHHFPELEWKWSYPIFWLVCLTSAGLMIAWFRRKGWL